MLISKHVCCCCWCETPDRNILTEKLAMIVRAPLPPYIIVHRRGGHKTQAINKLARTHNGALQRVSPPLSNQGDQQIIIKIVGRCNNQTTRHSQRCHHQDQDVDSGHRTGTVISIFTLPPTWHCVTCHADSWAVSRGQFVISSSDSVFGKNNICLKKTTLGKIIYALLIGTIGSFCSAKYCQVKIIIWKNGQR